MTPVKFLFNVFPELIHNFEKMKLFLSSSEYLDFACVRKIEMINISYIEDIQVLIVEVQEPLIGQGYGYGDKDIRKFYLQSRFAKVNFNEMHNFPIDVFVLIEKYSVSESPQSFKELRNIAWACLYDNFGDAIAHRPY